MDMYQLFVPEWNEEDNKRPKGMSVHDAFEMLKKEYGIAHSKEEFMERMNEFALDLYQSKAQMIDGIQHLFDRLDAMNIPIGIATASRAMWLDSALDLHNIRHRFAAISNSDDVEHSKPHPAVYLRTAKELGVDPLKCVALEDSTQGLTSAKAAGMYAIGLRMEDHLERAEDLALADMVIGHPNELTEEVLRSIPSPRGEG